MLKRLRLERFKSFADATLELGPFTLLVGTNASGKSNLRDAFRFLHGIGRGYTLAEIIGEKRSEGEKVWGGIRGGTRGLAFQGAETFALEVSLEVERVSLYQPLGIRNAAPNIQSNDRAEISHRVPGQLFSQAASSHMIKLVYRIEVVAGTQEQPPRVLREWLREEDHDIPIFEAFPASELEGEASVTPPPASLVVNLRELAEPGSIIEGDFILKLPDDQPILSQCVEDSSSLSDVAGNMVRTAKIVLAALKTMRFLDPDPEAMRQPAIPGQRVLSDRGENLASVLHAIASDSEQKEEFVTWMQMLTPMDVRDLVFESDALGRILLTLVEANGQKTSAYTASDGTLRFLALLAALLGPEPAHFHFFEELETGIHPTRLNLLLSLIEQQTAQGVTQVVSTTHSPQVLLRIAPDTLEHTALTYRLEGHPETRIKPIVELPHIRHLLDKQEVDRLYESGWLEDAVEFLENSGDEVKEDVPVAWSQE